MAKEGQRCETPTGSPARRKARRAELLANVALRSCAARRRRYALAGLSPPPLLPSSCSPGWWEAFAEEPRAEGDWVQNFRLRPAVFGQLVGALRGRLQARRIAARGELAAEKRVAIALLYLSSGKPFRELAAHVGVAPSTVADTVVEVCSAIERELLSKTVCLGPDVAQVMAGFSRLGIPHCIGAVDKISFRIRVSQGGAQAKQYVSIVLQGTVDAEGRFIDADLRLCDWRTPGSPFFLGSVLCNAMDAGVYVPGNPTLTLEGVAVPPLVIADWSYLMRRWLMTPYHLCQSQTEKHYNDTLNHTHSIAKRAFGRLKSRWKCLTVPSQLHGQDAVWMVTACVVLHNICEENGQGPPLTQRTVPEPVVVAKGGYPVRCRLLEAIAVRDVVARHMFANRQHSSSGEEMRG